MTGGDFAKLAAIVAMSAGLFSCAMGEGERAVGESAAREHSSQGARPMRIVSLNVCTDQLLMQMAQPTRIAGLSQLANDPQFSAMSNEARGFPALKGSAEEVIALKPDLVIAGSFSTRNTVDLLRRFGYRIVEFEPASDIAGIKANIDKMAQAIGEEERGAAMALRIDEVIAGLPAIPQNRPIYADYGANGFTSGDGILIANLANLAGFETLGQSLGVQGVRQVSIEQMLVSRPDVVDFGSASSAPALANENKSHPAFTHILRNSDRAQIPAQYSACGTMLTLKALDQLVEARLNMS